MSTSNTIDNCTFNIGKTTLEEGTVEAFKAVAEAMEAQSRALQSLANALEEAVATRKSHIGVNLGGSNE